MTRVYKTMLRLLRCFGWYVYGGGLLWALVYGFQSAYMIADVGVGLWLIGLILFLMPGLGYIALERKLLPGLRSQLAASEITPRFKARFVGYSAYVLLGPLPTLLALALVSY